MRIENYTAQELFEQLNEVDESVAVEAKALSRDNSRTIMETVCSFSNEPGLGGGVILLGVAENDPGCTPRYRVEELEDLDKAQLDFASQCASMFNIPVRPEISVEQVCGKNVLRIFVSELPAVRKPLYFKNEGIPRGIYRRIGSSDQRCNEEDLSVFYNREEACDSAPIAGATLADVDEEAVKRYRFLRGKVRPDAVELSMETPRLLRALGCVDREHPDRLNLAGVLLFGTAELQRQVCPAARLDYLRVPGCEWVKDPERSFICMELRGSLISVVYRALDAIRSDLPSGFVLKDDDIQAKSVGLPSGALREAVVNALMHRSYRVNRPTQIIRYDNRLEIVNAGYSLKPEDELGQPGSEARNPILADVFHELNLAEEKGSGIRRMQQMMKKAHLAAPAFESDREANKFTARLLLHHFLGDEDLEWLSRFDRFELDDEQKKALIFLREVGAINNSIYRQYSDADTLHASTSLREMRDKGLVVQQGRGNATYYVAGPAFSQNESVTDQPLQGAAVAMQDKDATLQGKGEALQDRLKMLLADPAIAELLKRRKKRMNKNDLCDLIVCLCKGRSLKSSELSALLGKNETYLRTVLASLVSTTELLRYTIPEMVTHPDQAYTAS